MECGHVDLSAEPAVASALAEPARLALLLAGCALAVTHELSPYMVGGVLVILVVFRLTRPWWVPAPV